jgi:hypothetical protein
MNRLLTILLLAAGTAYGQINNPVTAGSLGLGWPALTNSNSATALIGYDTNNGRIVYSGTNPLTFTNAASFGHFNESSPAFGVGVTIYGTLTMEAYEAGGESPPTLSVGSFTASGYAGTNTVTVGDQNGITFGGDAAALTVDNLGLGAGAATAGAVLTADGSGGSAFTRTLTNVDNFSANSLRVRTARTITNSNATGNTGDISWDTNYFYVAIGTNTWRRVALTNW